jgi:DNA-binding transcriptional MerR regulator
MNPQLSEADTVTKIYYDIGEIADMFGVAQSAIRYWLDEFKIPVKRNRKGNRKFTVQDIERVRQVHHLLKVELYTIEGVKRKLNQ